MRKLLFRAGAVALSALLILCIAVAAANAAGNGSKSDGAPKPPANLTVTVLSDSKIFLNWAASPTKKVDHYKVYRHDKPEAVKTVEANDTSVTDDGLAADTQYGYQVTAVKGDAESERYPKLPYTKRTEKKVDLLNCTGEGVVKVGNTCTVDPELVARKVIEAQGWKSDQVAIGAAADLNNTPNLRGPSSFVPRTLKTPGEIADLFKEDSDQGRAAKGRVQEALKPYPGEFDNRASNGGGYVAIQFKEAAVWYGTTYLDGDTVIDMRDPRSVPKNDVLWLYVTADGVPVLGASIRADCGNPNFTKIVPGVNHPPVPSIDVGPCGTNGQPACAPPPAPPVTCRDTNTCPPVTQPPCNACGPTTTATTSPPCNACGPTTTATTQPSCEQTNTCPKTTTPTSLGEVFGPLAGTPAPTAAPVPVTATIAPPPVATNSTIPVASTVVGTPPTTVFNPPATSIPPTASTLPPPPAG